MFEIKIKKYKSLGNNAYKVLFEGFSETKNTNLKEYEGAFKKVLSKNVKADLNTLANYKPLDGYGKFKTCIVYAERETMLVSKASLASKNLQTISKNVFLDANTNEMWKKVVNNGVVSLVQEVEEDLEAILKKRLDVSQAVAHSHFLEALATNKMDYVMFFNPETRKIESGLKLNSEETSNVVYNKNTSQIMELNPHCIITAASSSVFNSLETELNKLKTSKDKGKDALKVYLDFWFKTREGRNNSTQIDKALKNEILKQTASASNYGAEWVSSETDIQEDIVMGENEDDLGQSMIDELKDDHLTREEVETFVKASLDQTKLVALVDIVEESGKITLRFTQEGFSISDYLYVIKSIQESLPENLNIITEETSEFVLIHLEMPNMSEESMGANEISMNY